MAPPRSTHRRRVPRSRPLCLTATSPPLFAYAPARGDLEWRTDPPIWSGRVSAFIDPLHHDSRRPTAVTANANSSVQPANVQTQYDYTIGGQVAQIRQDVGQGSPAQTSTYQYNTAGW